MQDWNRESLELFANAKIERARLGRVIARVGGAIAGGIVNGNGGAAVAIALDGDGHARLRLDDLVGCRRKLQLAAHILGQALHPGHPAARQAANLRKIPAHHDVAIGLKGERVHGVVGTGANAETGVDRTIRAQPRQAILGDAVHRGKNPANDHAIIRLHEHGINGVVGRGGERRIGQSLAVESDDVARRAAVHRREITADKDFAIRLQRDAAHAAVRPTGGIEARIQRTVGVEPGNAVAKLTVNQSEFPANQPLAIGLRLDRQDGSVQNRRKGRIEHTVGLKAREVGTVRAGDLRESTADQNLIPGSHSDHIYIGIHALGRSKGRIHPPVAVQSSDAVPVSAADRSEPPAEQYLAIRLQGQAIDRIIESRPQVQTRRRRTIGPQPDEPVLDQRVQLGERSTRKQVAVGLQRLGVYGVVQHRSRTVGRIEGAGLGQRGGGTQYPGKQP